MCWKRPRLPRNVDYYELLKIYEINACKRLCLSVSPLIDPLYYLSAFRLNLAFEIYAYYCYAYLIVFVLVQYNIELKLNLMNNVL
jgi:hypothetical protein